MPPGPPGLQWTAIINLDGSRTARAQRVDCAIEGKGGAVVIGEDSAGSAGGLPAAYILMKPPESGTVRAHPRSLNRTAIGSFFGGKGVPVDELLTLPILQARSSDRRSRFVLPAATPQRWLPRRW
jgi:hypothetical protein